MNVYKKWIFPRLVDITMRNNEAMRYRSLIVPKASGTVLEIGIGSGLNLALYGKSVERLYGLDPSEELLAMAREKARAIDFPVDFLSHQSEEIPLDDHSVDTIVMTWTLCSIPDPSKALREMRRVLKPQGTLLFAEHGLAANAGVQRWQNALNPLWSRISGGCNLNRKMDKLIRVSGFRFMEIDMGYAKGPRPMSFMYWGRAVPVV